ncbi:MAG TPA: glycoside hydrolase family 48 protein, partial [Polyangia bacterium]
MRMSGGSIIGILVLGSSGLLLGSCLQTVAQQKAAAKPSRGHAQRPAPKTGGPAAAAAPTEPAEFPKPTPLVPPPHPGHTGNEYTDRFIAHWNALHAPGNGYFSPQGIPYHSAETLLVEAPDYGHHTTSEAYSYWMWLEATYGRISKDWKPLAAAWESTEAYMIPTQDDQPTVGSYTDTHPAVYAPEQDIPDSYPVPFDSAAPIGHDPLSKELKATYNSPFIYGMHWIIDVDNFYGFGRRGDRVSRPSPINTFQRGMHESVWETIPQPCWDDFQFGGPNGYLDLFVKQDGGYARQWKYTTAPDADARAVQAMYWAKRWADEQGAGSAVEGLVKKTAKMGDYLRYSLFDKYFKEMGCQDPSCPAAEGRGGAHYLISWYYAWGGSLTKAGGWSWRIGASASH